MKNLKNIYYIFIFSLFIPINFCFGLETVGVGNPIKVGSIPELIALILNAVVMIGTPIAVLFLIYGGFKYVTAKGNPNKISEANQYLMWTIVGIVILLGAELLAEIVKGTIEQLGTGIIN
jgi:hypothetical protein